MARTFSAALSSKMTWEGLRKSVKEWLAIGLAISVVFYFTTNLS
jgi:hypothetical protein